MELLGADEVRRRAATGAALLGARSIVIYVFGTAANLLLARLLVPRDFGLVALGTVLVVVGTYMAEGGFGAGLIRRRQDPQRHELEAILGLQLALTGVLAVVVAAVAVPFGRDGLVVATMVASLPIAMLRTPAVIVLERRLRYRVIATADVVEALSYYGWAVGAVALGMGVWGLATAIVVRAIAGTTTMLVAGPLGPVRPRWAWPVVRPLVAFGAKVQATSVLQIVREQGLNVVVAAVAGLATLGVWNLAWRVLQVPNVMFLVVGRVTFPAIARLLDAGAHVRSAVERGVAVLGTLTGVVVVGLVGFVPALPVLVGSGWEDVPATVLWSGIALVLAAPVSVMAAGYLFAAGDAGTVATATLVSAVAWFGVAAALLPSYGAVAVGIGWVGAGVLNSGILWRRTAALTGAAIALPWAGPTGVSLAALAAGWFVAHAPDAQLFGGVLGLVAGELVLLAGLALVSREALRDTGAIIRSALKRARRT